MRWRRFDPGWLASAWDDLRPRFARLTVRKGGVNLRWWVRLRLGAALIPLRALEQALKLAPLLLALFPTTRLCRYWPVEAPDTLTFLASLSDNIPLLRLPIGEPFLAISTPDIDIELREV